MTPQEKRRRTILERYGSYSNMLAKRDRRDLILGGFNGGIKQGKKGFATWKPDELKNFTGNRQRDEKGRFIPKEETPGSAGADA